MEQTGIELVLKENLQERLGKILPVLTRMNQEFNSLNDKMILMAQLHNRATDGFNKLGQSIDTVTRKERGLQNVNNQVKNVGMAATKATGQVGLLGASLGSLARTLGPLLGLYKLMQGVGFVGHEGLDFQKQVVALQQLKISDTERKAAIADSLRLGASGKYTMGGGEFLQAYREAVPVLPSAEDARKSLPEIGEMSMRLRRTGMTEDVTAMLPKLWEKYGQRTQEQRRKFDEALLKTEQFNQGKINLGQFLQQSGVAGTAIIGQDPLTAMTQLAYGIKESGSGTSGGGGGSRGRAGFGMQAIDRMLSLGQITAGTVDAWAKLGWLPGIEKFGKQAKGHKMLMDVSGAPVGEFTVTSGNMAGAGGKISVSQFKEYITKHPPAFLTEGASDQSAFARRMIGGAAQLAGLKGTPEEMLTQFGKLPAVEQKLWAAKVIPGVKSVGMQTLMEMSVGRYKQSFDRFKSGVAEQQGFNAPLNTAVQDRWEQMMSQFKTFADALMNNQKIVDTLTKGIDALSRVIDVLNKNVGPIAEWASGQSKQEKAIMGTTDSIGTSLGQRAFEAGQVGQHFAGQGGRQATHTKSGSKDWASDFKHTLTLPPGVTNFSTPHGNFLVPPPPPSMPSLIPELSSSIPKDFMKWSNKQQQQWMVNNSPTDITKSSPITVNTTINHQTMLDGKKIAEHTSHHIERKQMKTARQMSYATSQAGGSITDKPHNAGGGQ